LVGASRGLWEEAFVQQPRAPSGAKRNSYSPRKRAICRERVTSNLNKTTVKLRRSMQGRLSLAPGWKRASIQMDSPLLRQACPKVAAEETAHIKPSILGDALMDVCDMRRFVANQRVHSRYYIGLGKHEWKECILRDSRRNQSQYYVEWVEGSLQGHCKWVRWDNVWMHELESLEAHEKRIQAALNTARERYESLIQDPTIELEEESFSVNVNPDVLEARLDKLSSISPDIVKRVVSLAKPMRHGGDEKQTLFDNSPQLWRELLEEVHRSFLRAQQASNVKCLLEKQQAHIGPVVVGAKFDDSKVGIIRALQEKLEKSSARLYGPCVAVLCKIRSKSLHYEKNISLFAPPTREKSPMSVGEFRRIQRQRIIESIEQLKSNWFMGIYYLVQNDLLKSKKYIKDGKTKGFLQRFLRLVSLMLLESLSVILSTSLVAFRRAFSSTLSPVFKVEVTMITRRKAETTEADTTTWDDATTEATGWASEWINESAFNGLLSSDEDAEGVESSSDEDEDTVPAMLLKTSSRASLGSAGGFRGLRTQWESQRQGLADIRNDVGSIPEKKAEESITFELKPTVDEYKAAVSNCFEDIIYAVSKFPSIQAVIVDERNDGFDDNHVKEHLGSCGAIETHILDNTVDRLSVDLATAGKFCRAYTKTMQFKYLGLGVLDQVEVLEDEIASLFTHQPSGLLMLDLTSLKYEMGAYRKSLRERFLSSVLRNALKACAKAKVEYDSVYERLQLDTNSIESLERLFKEIESIPQYVKRLSKRISKYVIWHFDLLEREGYRPPQEEWQKRWETVSLPLQLIKRANYVQHAIESKKLELENTLSYNLTEHSNRVKEVYNQVKQTEKWTDVNRVEEFASRCSTLEESLDECDTENKAFLKYVEIFDISDIYRETVDLTNAARTILRPISTVWNTGSDVMEYYEMWFKGSLLKLEPDGILDKISELQQNPYYSKDSTNGIIMWIENRIRKIRNTERIVRALCAKGLKQRHWEYFVKRYGLTAFELTRHVSLEMVMLEHSDVLDHLEELEGVGETAAIQYEYENRINEMEREYNVLIGSRRVPEWKVEVMLNSHQAELEKMKSSEQVGAIRKKIEYYEAHIASMFAKFQSTNVAFVEARGEELAVIRSQDPRLYLLDDEFLAKHVHNGKLDVFNVLPLLYPFYAIPAQLNRTRTRKLNLLDSNPSNAQNNARDGQQIASIVNDVGEQFLFRTPVECTSLMQVEHEIANMLKKELSEALHFLRTCVRSADERPVSLCVIPTCFESLIHFVERWSKQICTLTVRILFSEVMALARAGKTSRRPLRETIFFDNGDQAGSSIDGERIWANCLDLDIKTLAEGCREYCTKRQPHKRRKDALSKLRNWRSTLEALLLIALNQRDHSYQAPELQYQISPGMDVLVHLDQTTSINYAFEVVSGHSPTALLLSSNTWALSLTKAFYDAELSLLVQEKDFPGILSFAGAMGKHCCRLSCETENEFHRIQQGITLSSAWAIIEERLGWHLLLESRIESTGIVFCSRKIQLPEHLRKQLTPFSINVDMETLRAQHLVRVGLTPVQRSTAKPALSQNLEPVAQQELVFKEHVDLYLSRYSEGRRMRTKILSFLRRTGEHTWEGKPTTFIVHDSGTVVERAINSDCIEVLEALRGNRDCFWKLVNVSIQFVTDPVPDNTQCETVNEIPYIDDNNIQFHIVYLDSNQRVQLEYLESIPSLEELEMANDGEKSVQIVVFDPSEELNVILKDFPRIRREAKVYRLAPWWLDSDALLARSDFEEESTSRLAVRGFLEGVALQEVRPGDYAEFCRQVKHQLSERLEEAAVECEKYTSLLEELNELKLVARREAAAAQETKNVKEKKAFEKDTARLQELELHEDEYHVAITRISGEIQNLPEIVVANVVQNSLR